MHFNAHTFYGAHQSDARVDSPGLTPREATCREMARGASVIERVTLRLRDRVLLLNSVIPLIDGGDVANDLQRHESE